MSLVKANEYKDSNGTGNAAFHGTPVTPGGLNFRNRIINGAMMIDQRNAGASVSNGAGGLYTLDRWNVFGSQASKVTIQQNAASVTPPAGFKNYLGVTSSSAYTVGASESFSIRQYIEGFNTSDLNFGSASAATITLSFWVRSSLTGAFGGTLYNGAGDRFYPFSYTINSANTWEQKFIVVAGNTSGTWVGATNGTGLVIQFSLGAGSSVSGTAGAWTASAILQPTGSTSIVGTNGATFYLTGVQLEAGSVAAPFERRPYGLELALCQRYYNKLDFAVDGYASFYVEGATNAASTFMTAKYQFPVTMRATPTFVSAATFTTTNCSSVSNLVGPQQHVTLFGSSNTANLRAYAHLASGVLSWSAEL
jgi:hypothetical protein